MWVILAFALISSDSVLSTGPSTLSTGSDALSPQETTRPIAGSEILRTAYEVQTGSATAFLVKEISRLEKVVQGTKKKNISKENKQIREIVSGVLDLDHLGQRALVSHWEELAKTSKGLQMRDRYLKLFRELVEENYLEKAKKYVSGNYHIPFLQEEHKGNKTRVLSRIKRKDVDLILEFFLSKKDEKVWRVTDIRLDETSLEGTYRSNFNRVIRKQGGLESGFPELLRVMDKRLKELRAEGGATRL